VIGSNPTRGKREEREPEEQMQIGTQNSAADLLCGLEQMMMVVPIDAEVNET